MQQTQTSSLSALSRLESADLTRLEGMIERGRAAYHQVGRALGEIRDRRLYRATHRNFEDYCQGKWGFSRVQAHRLIQSTSVIDDLLPVGNTRETSEGANIPQTERQARTLVPLDAEQRRDVWARATAPEAPPVTTARLEELIRNSGGSTPEEQLAEVEAEEAELDRWAAEDDAREARRRQQTLEQGVLDALRSTERSLAAALSREKKRPKPRSAVIAHAGRAQAEVAAALAAAGGAN